MAIRDMDEFGDANLSLKKKSKKLPIIIISLVVIGLLGWTGVTTFFKIKFGDFQPPFTAPNVVVSVIENKTIQDEIEAIGTAKAAQSAIITANVSEAVKAIPVRDGAIVQKGDVIAVLNDNGERENVNEARAAYKRYQELARLNIAPKARAEQEEARLAVAEASLNDRVITAPFTGTIGLIDVEVGDMVEPGMRITTIDNAENLEVEFTIPENFIADVGLNMPITATSDAFLGEEFNGIITAIDSRINEQTRALRLKALIPQKQWAVQYREIHEAAI